MCAVMLHPLSEMNWSVQYTDTDSLLTFLKSCLGPNMLIIAPYHRMMKAVARNDVCVFKINEMSVLYHILYFTNAFVCWCAGV